MCCAAPATGEVVKGVWGDGSAAGAGRCAALERRDHRRRPGPHSTACHSHRASYLCIAFYLPPRSSRTKPCIQLNPKKTHFRLRIIFLLNIKIIIKQFFTMASSITTLLRTSFVASLLRSKRRSPITLLHKPTECIPKDNKW